MYSKLLKMFECCIFRLSSSIRYEIAFEESEYENPLLRPECYHFSFDSSERHKIVSKELSIYKIENGYSRKSICKKDIILDRLLFVKILLLGLCQLLDIKILNLEDYIAEKF